MSTCVRRYLQYKNDCKGIDPYADAPSISDVQDIDALSMRIKSLMEEYGKISKCMNGRIRHREKCILPEDRDLGHDLQIELLEQKLNSYEQVFANAYTLAGSLMNRPIPVHVQSIPEEDTTPATTVSSRRGKRIKDAQLENLGYDAALIPNDQNIRRKLIDDHSHLMSLFTSKHPERILGAGFLNKYIFTYVIPRAIKQHREDILSISMPYISYLFLKKDPLASYLIGMIENYALNTDSSDMAASITFQDETVKPDGNIQYGSISLYDALKRDAYNIVYTLIFVARTHDLIDSNIAMKILTAIARHINLTTTMKEGLIKYSISIAMLAKYINISDLARDYISGTGPWITPSLLRYTVISLSVQKRYVPDSKGDLLSAMRILIDYLRSKEDEGIRHILGLVIEALK